VIKEDAAVRPPRKIHPPYASTESILASVTQRVSGKETEFCVNRMKVQKEFIQLKTIYLADLT
jgi:hypothetical protein